MNEIVLYHNQISERFNTKESAIIQYIESQLEGDIFEHVRSNKNTYGSYLNGGRKFLEYLKENGFNAKTMEHYANYLNEQKISANTKAARGRAAIMVVKRVSHFREDLIPYNISMKLTSYSKFQKKDRAHKREGLHPDEVQKIKDYLFSMEEGPEKRIIVAQFYLLRFSRA